MHTISMHAVSCRVCLDLAYPWTHQHATERTNQRIITLQRWLKGLSGDDLLEVPNKPHMHWRTYKRHVAVLLHALYRHEGFIEQGIAKHEAVLERLP